MPIPNAFVATMTHSRCVHELVPERLFVPASKGPRGTQRFRCPHVAGLHECLRRSSAFRAYTIPSGAHRASSTMHAHLFGVWLRLHALRDTGSAGRSRSQFLRRSSMPSCFRMSRRTAGVAVAVSARTGGDFSSRDRCRRA